MDDLERDYNFARQALQPLNFRKAITRFKPIDCIPYYGIWAHYGRCGEEEPFLDALDDSLLLLAYNLSIAKVVLEAYFRL